MSGHPGLVMVVKYVEHIFMAVKDIIIWESKIIIYKYMIY